MGDKNKRICPVRHSGCLNNKIRKLFQNPQKILGNYVKDGMTVLDLGCGPGFFSVEMAKMVGGFGGIILSINCLYRLLQPFQCLFLTGNLDHLEYSRAFCLAGHSDPDRLGKVAELNTVFFDY